MDILIILSALTSVVVIWRVKGFWISLAVSTTVSFVIYGEAGTILYAELGNSAENLLVSWRDYLVLGSLAVSAGCFLVTWSIWLLLQRHKRRAP